MPSNQSNGPPAHHTQQTQTQQNQRAAQDDLIDFGGTQSSAPVPAPSAQGNHTQIAQQPANAPPGLQQPLQPGPPLQRIDTLTKDLDEFVDAKPM